LGKDPQIQLTIIPNFLDGFTQLNAGSIDAVVVDYRVGSYIIAANNLRNIKVAGDPILPSYSSFAVKKGNTELLNEINSALQMIKSDGTYQKILDTWQPKEVVFQTQDQILHIILYVVLSVLFILFVIVAVWMVTLRKELFRRKTAEKAEEKAEKFAERIISYANAMIVGLDIEGKVIIFNEAAEKISGYKKDEVMGYPWFELVVPRDRFPEVWKAFEEFQKKGKSIVGEFQNPILTKSGEERMIEWRNADLLDDGQVVGTISYGLDITEKKRDEEKIKQLNQRDERILNSAGEGIYGVNFDGNIVFINTPAAKMLGYDVQEMIGKNSHALFHHTKTDGSPYPVEECPLYRSLNEGDVLRGQDEVFWTHDGKTFDVEYVATPLMDNGKVVGAVVVFKDITERKRAEEALRESRDRYRHTLDSMLEGCQIIGFDWRYLYVNDAAAKHGLRAKEELLGHTMMEIYPGIEKTDMFAALRRCMEDHISSHMENEFVYPDNTKGWFELSIQLVPEGVFVLSADITERKKMEEHRKQFDEAKDEFLNLLAHHMRTIPGTMKWLMELLEPKIEKCLTTEDMKLWHSLDDSDTRLIELADVLSAAAQEELEKILVTPVKFDLPELIDGKIHTYQQIIETNKLNIIREYQEVKEVILDKNLVGKVISTLVSNAIRYTPPEGTVEITLSSVDHTFKLTIKDSGVGIPKNQQEKVFSKFFRAKNVEKMDVVGLGLGLYIAKRIVERLKGKIWFESEEGKGSTFYLELPY